MLPSLADLTLPVMGSGDLDVNVNHYIQEKRRLQSQQLL